MVSISTTRDTPSAFGLPGQAEAPAGAATGAAAGAGAGACETGATGVFGAAANEGEFCASTVGALGAAGALGMVALGAAALGAAALGVGRLGAAAGEVAGTAAFCDATGAGAGLGATAGAAGVGATAGVGGISRSSKVVITVRSAGAACAGEVEAIGTEDFCDRMAPNTATQTRTIIAQAIAASRMAILPHA